MKITVAIMMFPALVVLAAQSLGGKSHFSGKGNLGLTCVSNILIDFDAGTDGQALSAALVNSSSRGNYGSNYVTPGDMFFSTDSQKNLVNPVNICAYHRYFGNGLVGFKCGTSSNVSLRITLPYTIQKLSWGYWFRSTIPGTSIVYVDSCITAQDSGPGPNDYLNVSLESGPTASEFRMGMEHHGGHPLVGYFATNTWYWITAVQDTTVGGVYQIKWYDSSLNLVTNVSDTHEVGATNIYSIAIGNVIAGQSTPGFNLYYDNFKIDISGNAVFPLMP